MNDVVKIYLIRHARQESPLCNVNVSLADEGLLQSKLLGERLRKDAIDQVYASDLIRAQMTAEIIIEQLKENENFQQNELQTFKDLREIDFGDLTGLSDEVIKEQFKDYFIERDKLERDIPIPGGENGSQVFERMNRGVRKIIDQAIDQNYKKIVIVSHGGAIRCFLAGILGMPQEKRFIISKVMENTSISEIVYHTDTERITVERINDYSHLEENPKLLRSNFK